MLADNLCKLADGLAVTDSDAYTTYSVDLGNVTPKREVGTGEPLCLVYSVGVAAAGSTDTSIFKCVSATSADLSSGTLIVSQRTIANASLTAGSRHVVSIPPGSVTQRYIGGRVELGSGDTITVDCHLMPESMVGIFTNYADAVTWS